MDVRLIFGLSATLSLLSSSLIAGLYVWPWLRGQEQTRALTALVAPHMLLRFIGLSFLVVGVVSPTLPAAFAIPAAYGDLIAGILAIVAVFALARRAQWAIGSVWLFNVVGAADLLFALFQGPRVGIRPGEFGATFFLPTAIVPALLVMHFLTFKVLALNSEGLRHRDVSKGLPLRNQTR